MDPVHDTSSEFIHPIESSPTTFSVASLLLIVTCILLGIGTGYLFSLALKNPLMTMTTGNSSTMLTTPKNIVVGSTDLATFKDTATGLLQVGGINGEGQYHLVRPGGDSQNVYLTSSIVDLSLYVGKKMVVHGQTQKAKYAGWLMDVGQVEVSGQ